jgi:hypothetical protein
LHKNLFIKDKDPKEISLSYQKLNVDDLSTGFSFNNYGLIVRKKYDVTLAAELSTLTESEQAEMALERMSLLTSLNADIDEIRDALDTVVGLAADKLATANIADALSEDAEHSGDNDFNNTAVEETASDDKHV